MNTGTMNTNTTYRRPFSALGHLLLALFSLGYLGITGRSCAVKTCTPKLAFLVATGAVSTVFSIIVAVLQCLQLRAAALFVWSLDVALLLWWAVAVALSSLIVESLTSPLSQPLLAFAWVCITLTLLLSVTALATGPCAAQFKNANSNTSNSSNNSTNSNSNSNSDPSLPSERDYVPEDRYMAPATGDPNYDATNLVGRATAANNA